MSAALKSIKGGNQQVKKQADTEKSIRPHCKISIEDVNWVRQQPPCVQQLWLDSIASEQFGGAAHKLDTNLTYKSFQKASANLSSQGLFQFEELFGRLPSGRPGLIGYRVRNLHGYYNRFYWESSTSGESNSCDKTAVHAGKEINHAEQNQNHPGVEQIHAGLESFQKNGQKSEDLQGFQNPNNVANYLLTTYQQPTKVVGMVVASDALARISYCGETAHAPLGGASPQTIKSASEEESSPTATDCTTLALVDAIQSQSALLLVENQDLGDEVRDCLEGTSSAAPPAQSEKLPQVVEATSIALLSAENEISGVEVKNSHEDASSAVSAVLPLKILTNSEILNILDSANLGICPDIEAIASLLKTPHARSLMGAITNNPQWGINLSDYSTVPQSSKLRSQRETKLKSYAAMGECPPDEFLQECLSDPVLAFKVKRMGLQKL